VRHFVSPELSLAAIVVRLYITTSGETGFRQIVQKYFSSYLRVAVLRPYLGSAAMVENRPCPIVCHAKPRLGDAARQEGSAFQKKDEGSFAPFPPVGNTSARVQPIDFEWSHAVNLNHGRAFAECKMAHSFRHEDEASGIHRRQLSRIKHLPGANHERSL